MVERWVANCLLRKGVLVWERKEGRWEVVQVLLEDVRRGCSGCVVGVYLYHELVEVLDYVFELFCEGLVGFS